MHFLISLMFLIVAFVILAVCFFLHLGFVTAMAVIGYSLFVMWGLMFAAGFAFVFWLIFMVRQPRIR